MTGRFDVCASIGSNVARAVVCKLLDLEHVGLGHAELGQRDWDTRYKDSGTGTCGTGTVL